MNPTKTVTVEPVAVSDDVLSTLVDAIKEDPKGQPPLVRERVQRFLGVDNVSMIGGWT